MEPSISSPAKIADAMNMLKSGSIDQAIIDLKAISVDTPDDPQVYTCLGVAYTQKGDKQDAIRSFKKSLALQENPKAHYNLGLAYESAGMEDEAAQSYHSAILVDPTYTLAAQAIERLTPTTIAPTPPAQEPTIIGVEPISPEPTIMGEPPPVVPEPEVIGHIPDFGAPSAPPDFAREEAEKAQRFAEQRRDYMKSSLIYGIVCGSFFMFLWKGLGVYIATAMPGVTGLMIVGMILGVLFQGSILGGLIGLWIGYTCGDDMQGLIAGAVIGAVFGLFDGLIHGMGVLALFSMLGGAIGTGLFGYIVGRMVESSIN